MTDHDSRPDPIGIGSFGHVYQIHWNDGESKALKMIRSGTKPMKVSTIQLLSSIPNKIGFELNFSMSPMLNSMSMRCEMKWTK